MSNCEVVNYASEYGRYVSMIVPQQIGLLRAAYIEGRAIG